MDSNDFSLASSDKTSGGAKKLKFKPSLTAQRRRKVPTESDSERPPGEDSTAVVELGSSTDASRGDAGPAAEGTADADKTRSAGKQKQRGARFVELTASGPFAYGPSAFSFAQEYEAPDDSYATGRVVSSDNRLKTDVANAGNLATSFVEDPWAPVALFGAPDDEDDMEVEFGDEDGGYKDVPKVRTKPKVKKVTFEPPQGKNSYIFGEDEDDGGIEKTDEGPPTFNEEDNHLFLFQLPPALPEYELVQDSDKQQQHAQPYQSETTSTMRKEDALESTEKEPDIAHYPEGRAGELVVYKDGTVKLKLGTIEMDVHSGAECTFLQNVVVLNPSSKGAYCLGNITKQFVCAPNIDKLLGSSDDDDDKQKTTDGPS